MSNDLANILNKLFVPLSKNPKYFLDTGYKPLNKAISGKYSQGIKNGMIMEISGWESSGKTAISTQLMKACQEMGGIAMFYDFERSFDYELAKKQGLRIDNTFLYSKQNTAEDSVEDCENKIKLIRGQGGLPIEKPIVVVYDSIPCMTPRSIYDKENANNSMKDNLAIPMMLNVIMPRIVQLADSYNVTFVFINQLRDNIGVMYGPKEKTPGGKAKDFYFSLRLKCKRQIISDKKNNKVGQLVEAECIKNKQSAPFGQCSWFFKYNEDGTGSFDTVGSTIDYCIENKIGGITGSGAWFEFNGQKYQGKEALKKALQEDPNTYSMLEKALDELDSADENN